MPPEVDTAELWKFLIPGYLVTIAIEIPVLLVGLSARHSLRDRLMAGWWLTACTYPIVILVMPPLLDPPRFERWVYLAVSETFAPVAECTLFWLAYGDRRERWRASMWRDLATVTLANLASFLLGSLIPIQAFVLGTPAS